MLELARLFGSLFSAFQTRGLVNMIFLLTSGSAFNYLGADKWASEVARGKGVIVFEGYLVVSRADLRHLHAIVGWLRTASGGRRHPVAGLCTLSGLYRSRPRAIFPRKQKTAGNQSGVRCKVFRLRAWRVYCTRRTSGLVASTTPFCKAPNDSTRRWLTSVTSLYACL